MSFEAEFNLSDIAKKIKKAEEEIEKNIFSALSYVGEEYLNRAKVIRTYENRTGNLRASLGYSVLKDGRELSFITNESTTTAISEGKEVVNELRSKASKGYALVVFAGMEYAAAVESNNYDVITGSAPSTRQVEKDLKELLGGINI